MNSFSPPVLCPDIPHPLDLYAGADCPSNLAPADQDWGQNALSAPHTPSLLLLWPFCLCRCSSKYQVLISNEISTIFKAFFYIHGAVPPEPCLKSDKLSHLCENLWHCWETGYILPNFLLYPLSEEGCVCRGGDEYWYSSISWYLIDCWKWKKRSTSLLERPWISSSFLSFDLNTVDFDILLPVGILF